MNHQDTLLFQHPLPPSISSTEWFKKLNAYLYPVLLQSAKQSTGRYCIISAEPQFTILNDGQETRLIQKNETTRIEGDPLEYLIAQLPPTLSQSAYPFIGGIIGYWAYDWGVNLQQIPRRMASHHGLPLFHLGLYDWAIIVDHHHQTSTYVSYRQDKDHLSFIEKLLKTENKNAPFELTQPWESSMDYPQYQQAFSRIQEHLHAGDCYQVNFSQRFFAEYMGDPWQAYQALTQSCSSAFCAYLNCGDHQILSVSPERFLKISGNQVETKPIKGTRPRGKTKIDDQILALELQMSEKDQAENIMIVDMLRNDLGRLCTAGSISVPYLCALESYHNVHHLVSTIHGTLPADCHPLQLLKSSFPGASITGAPKKRVMEIIEQLETHQRHIYCGTIGYYSADGQLDTNIAIRTALCYEGQIEIAGGGGIVLDSRVEEEYQEIQNKIGTMLDLLSL